MKTKKTTTEEVLQEKSPEPGDSRPEEDGQNLIKDPVLFATRILGATLWEREVEILRSIQGSPAYRHQGLPRRGQDLYPGACGALVAGPLRGRNRPDHRADPAPGRNPAVVRDPSSGGALEVCLSGD